MLGHPRWCAEAGAHFGDAAVGAVERQAEAARAQAAHAQVGAELPRQDGRLGFELRGGDERIGPRALHEQGRRLDKRPARLGAHAQGLVKTRQHRLDALGGAKAALQGGTRQAVELADAPQAEAFQQQHGSRRQAQGFDGQRRQPCLGFSSQGDRRRGREAGERVRGAKRIGEAGARGQAEARQPGDEVVHELGFAAVEMGDAGDVDPQAVIAVDVAIGSVTAAPAGKTQQRRAIAARIGRLRRQTWKGGARVRQRLTDAHALLRRAHIDGGDANAVRARLDKGEGRIIGNQRWLRAAHPLDGPQRQPHGNDAFHPTIPTGEAQARASAGGAGSVPT